MLATVSGLLIAIMESIVRRARRRGGKPATARGSDPAGAPSGFDTLRTNHARRGKAIEGIERQLRETLWNDRHGVIEAERIAAQTGQRVLLVRELLKELVTAGALRKRRLWQCPRGLGTTAEAERVDAFPAQSECERCGEVHTLDQDHVEVVLIATQALQRELANGASRPQETATTARQPTD